MFSRKNYSPAFKAKVALAALSGEKTTAEFTSEYGVHSTISLRTGADKRRNWPAYSERTMNYAFGYVGDRDLQRNAQYIELWRKIELRQDSAAKTGARLR